MSTASATSPGTSNARSRRATRSRSSSRPCPARPTNSSAGARKRRSLYDSPRIRRHRRLGRTGHRRPAGASCCKDMGIAARSWQGWQMPIQTDDAHGAARIAKFDGQAISRRASPAARSPSSPASRACSRDQPRDARSGAAARIPPPWRSPRRSRPTAATSTPTSTASTPPTRASCRRRSGSTRYRLRGNARNGLARRQGAAGALGRTRHGAQGQALCALVLRRSRRPQARHADLRRGRHRGTAGRDRHRLLARRGADHAARRRRQAGRRCGDLRAAGRGQHQRRHDHPGRLRRHDHDRHDLHRAAAPSSSAPGISSESRRDDDRLRPSCKARRTW